MHNDDTTPGSEHQPSASIPDPTWSGPPAGPEQTSAPPPAPQGGTPSHWPHPAGASSWEPSASPNSELPAYGGPDHDFGAPGYGASAYGAPGYGATWPGDGAPGDEYGASGLGYEAPDAGHRYGGGALRRRFGALALGAALVAGGGAGAATSALVASGSSNVASAPTHVSTSPVALSTNTSSTQALVAKVEPALVDIHTTGTSVNQSPIFGNGNNPFGGSTSTTAAAGTGMILNSSGLVLTNAHVLEGANAITVTLNGKTGSQPATLVGEDAAKDIALIQIKGVGGLPSVSLGDSSKAQAGDPVLAMGNALDLQNGGFTVSEGIVSGLNRSIQTDNSESLTGLIQTSAAISSGDSGGPLVDAAGQVIGMDTAAAASSSNNTASNIGFAIPANHIKDLISQLQKGSIGQTTTGGQSSSGSASGAAGSGGSSNGGYGGYGGSGSNGGYGSGSGGYGSGSLFG
ncbi:MAG: trypsin-like peptidase domain-containing protein [Actinomycetota bacterium]|nr:trypsin-like peptidase domain-containing protein [Actinomycetota bacterium]